MNDYCIQPPFISQAVPPLLMFVMNKEHRLFTEAYSDSFDLDNDGKIETTYKHNIEYYGYFDPNKCYTYQPRQMNSSHRITPPLLVPTQPVKQHMTGFAAQASGMVMFSIG
jgi:hypothetical protein